MSIRTIEIYMEDGKCWQFLGDEADNVAAQLKNDLVEDELNWVIGYIPKRIHNIMKGYRYFTEEPSEEKIFINKYNICSFVLKDREAEE